MKQPVSYNSKWRTQHQPLVEEEVSVVGLELVSVVVVVVEGAAAVVVRAAAVEVAAAKRVTRSGCQ
jgi:hypothetical protein